MKKLYILVAGLLFLLAAACNKDDSTGASRPATELNVTGLQDTFNVYTHRDFLKASPVVGNEQDFDYYWTLFSTSNTPGQGLIIPDTLARTKDLNYEVKQTPNTYILVFNAKQKSSGVVKQFNMIVNITTVNMRGWYLVKDNGGKTDMDFIYPTGRIDNWMAYYNNGKSLEGNALKGIYVPQMKPTPTSSKQFPAIMVVSTNDAAIYRVDDGAMEMNYDSMFFTKPAVRKPQGVFQPTGFTSLGFINDGKAYNMEKGTLFSAYLINANNTVYDNVSPMVAAGGMDLGWNKTTRTVFCYNLGSGLVELKATNGSGLKNMNADLVWMTGNAGHASTAMMLFRNPQDSGYLFKLSTSFGTLMYGTGQMILDSITLKPEHGLMHADARCGNYDVAMIYYAKGGDIYKADLATGTETYLFTLPAGETVTCMQHIRYPETTPAAALSNIAIATYKDGRYKVYRHLLNGTHDIVSVPMETYEGEGRISNVFYMENGVGSRIF